MGTTTTLYTYDDNDRLIRYEVSGHNATSTYEIAYALDSEDRIIESRVIEAEVLISRTKFKFIGPLLAAVESYQGQDTLVSRTYYSAMGCRHSERWIRAGRGRPAEIARYPRNHPTSLQVGPPPNLPLEASLQAGHCALERRQTRAAETEKPIRGVGCTASIEPRMKAIFPLWCITHRLGHRGEPVLGY